MSSDRVVPDWNLGHQRQEQVDGGDSNRSSSHKHILHNSRRYLGPMSIDHKVSEIPRKNGQLAMHGYAGLLPFSKTKSTWCRTNETLDSIVHQATISKKDINLKTMQHVNKNPTNMISSILASSSKVQMDSAGTLNVKKRGRSECNNLRGDYGLNKQLGDHSGCASVRDTDKVMVFFESPKILKTKTTDDEDSDCHWESMGAADGGGETKTKGETSNSYPTKRGRAATTHSLSERRRRDRINEKMKALQKLVPNASKTDKASMLDEVIEYLKQLQAQVNMMLMIRSNSQMMLPLGMQQQLQMSLLARMGMMGGLGMGMGILGMGSISRPSPLPIPSLVQSIPVTTAISAFLSSPFLSHPPSRASQEPGSGNSVPLPDPFGALLSQPVNNVDLYAKMVAQYRQQANQASQATSSKLSSELHGD